MSTAKRDYYEILEVDRNADEEGLKRAFRKKAVQYHPDRNPGDKSAEEKFKEASEAYKVLSDPEQRRVYDAYGHQGLEGTGFHGFSGMEDIYSFSDIFSSVLGDLFGFGGFGGRSRSAARRGANLKALIRLTMDEAFRGMHKELKVNRHEPCSACRGSGAETGGIQTCPDCRGTGQSVTATGFLRIQVPCRRCGAMGRIITRRCNVCHGEGAISTERRVEFDVPPGVDTGDTLKIRGEGEGGSAGGPPGDLLVVFEVEPHPFLKREGPDLHLDLPVSFTQALLGDKIEVESIDGRVKIEVPAGAQPDHVIELRKQGMPDPNSGRRGSLVVHVRVAIPKDLTREQKRAVQDLAKLFQK